MDLGKQRPSTTAVSSWYEGLERRQESYCPLRALSLAHTVLIRRLASSRQFNNGHKCVHQAVSGLLLPSAIGAHPQQKRQESRMKGSSTGLLSEA